MRRAPLTHFSKIFHACPVRMKSLMKTLHIYKIYNIFNILIIESLCLVDTSHKKEPIFINRLTCPGSQKVWSLSLETPGMRWDTPWTRYQSTTGHSHTHSHQIGKLEMPANPFLSRSTFTRLKPHLVYGVEEAPVEVSEHHRHVPCIDAEKTRWPLSQFHTLC